MDLTVVLFIINGLMGVVMFFMAQALTNNKEKFKKLESQHEDLREKTLLKEDFRDFKTELWARLDQLLKTKS